MTSCSYIGVVLVAYLLSENLLPLLYSFQNINLLLNCSSKLRGNFFCLWLPFQCDKNNLWHSVSMCV